MIRADLGAWGLRLIAVALAYLVCLKASKEGTKLFQYGGYAIGVIILAISLMLAMGDVITRIKRNRRITRRPVTRTTRPTTTPRVRTQELPRVPSGAGE
jgi:hypothetical protein